MTSKALCLFLITQVTLFQDYCLWNVITTLVFTWECAFLCTFVPTLFVMLVVIMAHAFQPLENIGHIEVYRLKKDL